MWRELGGLSALAALLEWVRRRRFRDLLEESDEVFLSGVLRQLPTAKPGDVLRERGWIAVLSGLPRKKVAYGLRLADLIERADAGLALQPGDLLEDLDRRLGVV
ncbi:MAG TPA: hypothetical protein VI195_09750, partial [Steroidobacteraceae bacterium]